MAQILILIRNEVVPHIGHLITGEQTTVNINNQALDDVLSTPSTNHNQFLPCPGLN